MKNIHLLPTDKPSRLHLWTDENGTRPALCELEYSHTRNTQHIYITCDEKIKEGVDQWYLDKVLNEPYNSGGAQYSSKQDVIILTTDKDLIKDGVQSISDEFLQWFVKNPSCEEVEVILNEVSYFIEDNIYKIIIPKEEPTAYHYLSCCRSVEECHCGKYPKQFKCDCSHTTTCDCSPIEEQKDVVLGYKTSLDAQMLDKVESKQQTLEKAAHKMLMDFGIMSVGESINVLNVKKLMVLFAKEQQERMYSEEEVRNLFRNYQYDSAQFAAIMEGDTDGKPTPTGWFEKFKKK